VALRSETVTFLNFFDFLTRKCFDFNTAFFEKTKKSQPLRTTVLTYYEQLQLTPDDLRQINSAGAKIPVQGARYPENPQKRINR
jgi:hypothetical protein